MTVSLFGGIAQFAHTSPELNRSDQATNPPLNPTSSRFLHDAGSSASRPAFLRGGDAVLDALLAHAEVGNLAVAVRVEQDVVQLEITETDTKKQMSKCIQQKHGLGSYR